MRLCPFLALLLLFACGETNDHRTTGTDPSVDLSASSAQQLIDESIAAMGGMDAYRELENVSYRYLRAGEDGPRLISEEAYLYPDEESYGRYPAANDPEGGDERGVLEQWYQDDTVRVTFNGESVYNPQALERARFSRKTNFYWLNMFFKLRDPGLTYDLLDDRTFDGQTYRAVEVSFAEGVGDVKDTYLLYINPETKLIDYFLFTVMAADRSEPIMMKVEYEEVGSILWPVGRSSLASNWDGELAEDAEWPPAVRIENLRVNSDSGEAPFID